MSEKYSAARLVMRFIAIVGWITFGVGIVAALVGASNIFSTIGLSLMGGVGFLGGISAALAGLIQVAISQVAFAILDMADNSRRSLALQEKMADAAGIEVTAFENMSKPHGKFDGSLSEIWTSSSASSGVKGASHADNAATKGTREGPSGDSGIRQYKGETIEKVGNRYYWGDEVFSTLGKAKNAIATQKG